MNAPRRPGALPGEITSIASARWRALRCNVWGHDLSAPSYHREARCDRCGAVWIHREDAA